MKTRYKNIKLILKTYSNQTLASVTKYPVEQIQMFRKNDVDHFAVRTDSKGRGIPTRGVMENAIIQKVYEYELEHENKFNGVNYGKG